MSKVSLIVNKLVHNRNFIYLFNQVPLACFDGRTFSTEYITPEEFTAQLINKYTDFPAEVRVLGSAAASMDVINSVANYIINWMFMVACLDAYATPDRFTKSGKTPIGISEISRLHIELLTIGFYVVYKTAQKSYDPCIRVKLMSPYGDTYKTLGLNSFIEDAEVTIEVANTYVSSPIRRSTGKVKDFLDNPTETISLIVRECIT